MQQILIAKIKKKKLEEKFNLEISKEANYNCFNAHESTFYRTDFNGVYHSIPVLDDPVWFISPQPAILYKKRCHIFRLIK